jgi:hypothetical protein
VLETVAGVLLFCEAWAEEDGGAVHQGDEGGNTAVW